MISNLLPNIIALFALIILFYTIYLYNNKQYILSGIAFTIFYFLYALNHKNLYKYNIEHILSLLSFISLVSFRLVNKNKNQLFYKISIKLIEILVPISLILFILETTFDIFKNPKSK